MESIPTLNTFQLALLPDCSAEAEQELVNVARVLLVSAIARRLNKSWLTWRGFCWSALLVSSGHVSHMESIPTLNTFQLALLPDCSAEAEQELVNVARVLLVSAIEDPGIPHPGRHTTLLGHAIRMGDITSANLSEILRIYLYANATGEIKALTGLTAERERERRVADHHQTEAEMQHTQANSKNAAYYEHLHNNATYKLSEALRDKPFLALSATTKASILAFLCSELLQNKSVLRQIDASLEHLNQLKKERYLADMKIRKVRVLHQRKLRAEQCEKQQALALERMQRLVEESTHTNTAPPHGHGECSVRSNKRSRWRECSD
ncbi:hypothetical protein O0L34_g13204 [Tuta absoluta]|nr:hypothetical protein O0L34_g13204 [Tuta absoluta]